MSSPDSNTQPSKTSKSGEALFKKKPSPQDFIFGKLIGEGSFSSVYLTKEVKSGNEFAIKVLEKSHITREKKTEYVRRERDVFAMIGRHAFFVHLYCTFQDEERLYFVLSYARRGELLDYIKKLGNFDMTCTQFYTAEIILALEYLRKLGIVHRDLKPENILLNDQMHIQITDFGSAKMMNAAGAAASGDMNAANPNAPPKRRNSFVGTAQYVSPEVLRSKTTHYSSDLWALGCIIYQLLSGKVPFFGGHEYQIFQKIINLEYEFPEGFEPVVRDLVEKLLVVEADERLGSEKSGGFEALKSHAFYEGFNWENLEEQKAPELGPYVPGLERSQETPWDNKKPGFNPDVILPGFDTPITNRISEEERQKKLDEQSRNNKYHRFLEGNLIIKQGLIDKRKGLFARRRMFLMTEGPHLYYVDPQNMVLKGEVPWSKELWPEPKNFKIFFVHTPNRTYYLEDPQGNALIWCKEIEKVYARYYGDRTATPNSSTTNSDKSKSNNSRNS